MKHIILSILLLIVFVLPTKAQNTSQTEKPKLAVIICVDGLQGEHLSLMWNSFSNKGFKRIASQSRYYPNVVCNYIASGTTSDYASLMTATVPFYHGITGDKIYDENEEQIISIVYDTDYESIAGKSIACADRLQAMTITDALKAASPQSHIDAIALTPECAVMLGGHAANNVVWIDNNGKIATSTYYNTSLPFWATKMNNSGIVTSYTQSEWKPMYAINTYRFQPKNSKTFDGIFYKPQTKTNIETRIKAFRQTPYCNTLIKDLAINALKEDKLGKGIQTDMLCLQFTATVVGHSIGEFNTAEREDLYLKLDKDLELLLNAIDLQVGLEHTVILLTGTQADTYSSETLQQLRISAGTFQTDKTMVLLNGYLMSKHGDGRWIEGCHAQHITLNKSLIEGKGYSIAKFREETADFLTEFDGISSAYTAEQILRASGKDDDILTLLHNSYYKKRSGDVVFTLLPGWCVKDKEGEQVGFQGSSPRRLAVYLGGCGIAPQTQNEKVLLTDFIPTLCKMLQIPLPNATFSQGLTW
ncbi:MAG: alkaline phosphatase family protein [Bacteroidales bacterium]|nr:alkaline phosphatase family protein [Bacteroidales bacterium]